MLEISASFVVNMIMNRGFIMRRFNKLGASILAIVILCSAMPLNATAYVKQTIGTRGIVPLAYTQNYILYMYNDYEMLAADTWQKAGGLNFKNMGIQKLTTLSDSKKWAYTCTNASVFGISISGFSIGPSIVIIDRVTVTNRGEAIWEEKI